MIQNILKKFGRKSVGSLFKFFPQNSIISSQSYKFSTKLDEDPDSHSDFKPQSKQQITDDNVMKMIDDWVKNNKVCLFMKGVPQMPQCGFSNYVVQVMKFYNVKEYKSVNILENATLREAVKKYSNWPTYPQLYVAGSLVGNKQIN